MASEQEIVKRFAELDNEFLTREREPRHLVPKAGDRILVNRNHVTLKNNRELSTESVEVIDVVEKWK